MPISPNNLQFSLPGEYLERLRAKSQEGESLGLTAKRLLIALLDSERQAIKGSELTDLIDRVTSIENCLDNSFYPIEEKLTERVTALEEKVNSLESRDEREATESMTVDEMSMSVDVDISSLSDRLSHIESALADLQRKIDQATSPVKRPTSPPPPPGTRSRKK
jgi:TATA-binding protein-associated factor Taf7